jgi:peptide/nickel transport system substrate-binding protein
MFAAWLAVFSACAGDARRADPAEPLDLKIGTFLPQYAAQQEPITGLVNILSSESLVAVGWDGRPVMRLAESAAESEDGLTIRVKLRPMVKFHTGEAVTAARVRELLMRQFLKRQEVQDVTVGDGDTLLITLRRAHSLKVADLSDFSIDHRDELGLRTGPFKVKTLKPEAILEAFPDYYQGRPTLGRVEIRVYPTHRAAWTAMMRNEVNFLHEVNRDAIDFIEAGGRIRAYRLLRPYYVPLVFNLNHPVLRRREVRLALNEAIDRDEVVKNGMRGHGLAAEGPFWPYHWAYPQGRQTSSLNPAAAKVRLDSAGLMVRTQPGRDIPARFSFTCMLMKDDMRFERIALVLQRQLFAIGIDMALEPVEGREFFRRLASGEFDAFLFEMVSGRTLNWASSFWRSPAPGAAVRLRTGYTAADDALDRLKHARTDDEIRVAVSDVMEVIRKDPPAVFLAWPREARAADASLELEYEPDRDVFGSLRLARRNPLVARAK